MPGVRARRKAERPKQILEAAFDEFVAKGYSAARLEDVAARIGVTKGTIYFYFASKEELFEAALKGVADQSWAELQRREFRVTSDLIGDIRSFLGDLSRFVVENRRSRESFRLLVAEGDRFPNLVELYYRSFMGPIEELLQARLDRASRDGEVRPGLDHLTQIVLSPPLALQVMLLLMPDRLHVDRAAFLRSHVDVLAAGISAAQDDSGLKPIHIAGSRNAQADDPVGLRWTEWRPFPNPERGDFLIAPIGPGLYELRLADGESLPVEAAQNVAARLIELSRGDDIRRTGRSRSTGTAAIRHLATIHYRTAACRTDAEARTFAKARMTGASDADRLRRTPVRTS